MSYERESTQTNISSLGEELPARQHPLPWVLFGISAILLALVGGLLARRLSLETRRANEEIEKAAGLKAQIEQYQRMQAETDKKVSDAEAKAKEAQDASLESASKVKKVEAERDRLQKELEAAQKKLAAADAAAKKKPEPKKGKKKRRR